MILSSSTISFRAQNLFDAPLFCSSPNCVCSVTLAVLWYIGQVMFRMSFHWDWSDFGFSMIRPGHRYGWGRPKRVDAFTPHQGSVVLPGSSWWTLIFYSWWGSACPAPLLPGWSDLSPFHIDALVKKVTTDGPHFKPFDISFPVWWDSFLPFLGTSLISPTPHIVILAMKPECFSALFL